MSGQESENKMDATNSEIGFVGLGNMGSAMAEAVMARGYRVTAYDLDASAVSALGRLGARSATSISALAASVDVVCTSLPDSRAVREVYLGEEGLLSWARAGTIVVELSTIDPATIREVEKFALEQGTILLDVPVSGSPAEARRGELVLIAAGDSKALDEVRSILGCFGQQIQYVGPVGAGKTLKIVNNMMTMGNVLVAAEAFCVGVKAGMDPDLLFDVLSTSGGRSHHFVKRFPKAIRGDFNPGFSVALGEKDLELALEFSRSLGVPAPMAGLTQQIYRIAMSGGLSSEDIVAVIKVFEDWSGILARSSVHQEAERRSRAVETTDEERG